MAERRTAVEQLIIEEVLDGLEKPSLGLGGWVLPTLLQHGSDEQIERLIWPSLEGELRWCQLFSEPGAGSDAAAVATKAKKVDGGWSVTGQKVWTSDAMNCERGRGHGAHRSGCAQAQGHHRDDHRPRRPRCQDPAAAPKSPARHCSTKCSSTTLSCPTATSSAR